MKKLLLLIPAVASVAVVGCGPKEEVSDASPTANVAPKNDSKPNPNKPRMSMTPVTVGGTPGAAGGGGPVTP